MRAKMLGMTERNMIVKCCANMTSQFSQRVFFQRERSLAECWEKTMKSLMKYPMEISHEMMVSHPIFQSIPVEPTWWTLKIWKNCIRHRPNRKPSDQSKRSDDLLGFTPVRFLNHHFFSDEKCSPKLTDENLWNGNQIEVKFSWKKHRNLSWSI